MKPLLRILFLITIYSQAAAQGKGFVLEAGGAAGSSGLSLKNVPAGTRLQRKFSAQASLTAGYMLTQHIGLFSGLAYTSCGYRTSYAQDGVDRTQQAVHRLDYLDIPLRLRVATGQAHKIGLIADAGLHIGFLMQSVGTVKITDLAINAEQVIRDERRDGLNKTAVSCYLFLGLRLPVTQSVHMHAGIDYQGTFSDLYAPERAQSQQLNRYGGKLSVSLPLAGQAGSRSAR